MYKLHDPLVGYTIKNLVATKDSIQTWVEEIFAGFHNSCKRTCAKPSNAKDVGHFLRTPAITEKGVYFRDRDWLKSITSLPLIGSERRDITRLVPHSSFSVAVTPMEIFESIFVRV